MDDNAIIDHLAHGPLHRFADWPNPDVPKVAIGLYTVWRGGEFAYVGIAGRNTEERLLAAQAKAKLCGLADRLKSHAHGRRSGDQFCVYVADRLVLAALQPIEIAGITSGELSLDALVRTYIHHHLTYRYFAFEGLTATDQQRAYKLERRIQAGETHLGKPLLNPASTKTGRRSLP